VTLNLAQTSAAKSRPSVPYGANLLFLLLLLSRCLWCYHHGGDIVRVHEVCLTTTVLTTNTVISIQFSSIVLSRISCAVFIDVVADSRFC